MLANPAVTTQVCHDISQDIRVQLDILTYNVVTPTCHDISQDISNHLVFYHIMQPIKHLQTPPLANFWLKHFDPHNRVHSSGITHLAGNNTS